MRHHGLQRLGSTGTVRALQPVDLDRVVLGARSRQSLRWTGSEPLTGGLLELCGPGQWLLARQGDPLLLPRHPLQGEDPGQVQQQLLELLVLDCSPVTQGRITADTALVLTDCWDSVDTPAAGPPCRPLTLCVSDFAHYADGLGAGRSLLDSRALLGSGLSGVLQALECRLDVRVVDARSWVGVRGQRGAAVDLDSCVLVSKQLILRLGLFNHEWVKLSRPSGVCRERLVSVLVVEPTPSLDLQNQNLQNQNLQNQNLQNQDERASTHSAVPCCPVDGASLWSGLSPPGLNKTVELLCRIVLPHLRYSGSLSGCTVLLHGPAGSGKVAAVSAASRRLNLHLLKVDCVSLCADSPAASEVKLAAAFQRADAVRPCVLLLRNLQLLLRPRGGAEEDGRVPAVLRQLLHSAPSSVVVVATVCRPRTLSASVVAAFVHQVELESPTEEQRRSMLTSLSRDLLLGQDGFVLGDLVALLVAAGRSSCRRLILSCAGQQEAELCSSGATITNQDFTSALQALQEAQSTSIGAPQIPDVRWEDVGGLQQVKKEVLDTVQLPLQRPELLSLDLNRTGVLLYGPPGTGKTLLAKAVATECSMTFLRFRLDSSVDLQDVLDRCPGHMTGADLYALCSDAMTAAIKRKLTLIDHGVDSEDSPVVLSSQDFSSALENFTPSVSESELLRYRTVQQRLSAK
ncbi:Peroxisome assembly factor 2 [Larimichthys crocea]|uniref:Uncharacterized protein n=1 Tax=Larimichthys crocea TaxID=215358 RepID=A0ACD3RVE6_LARCR|nr:Peroxisome assembly factor 2 [Larimichthys crocea]